jgi:hypothetical protein
MINKYYINIQLDEINNAGSKAVNDCNQILKNNGVKEYVILLMKQTLNINWREIIYVRI